MAKIEIFLKQWIQLNGLIHEWLESCLIISQDISKLIFAWKWLILFIVAFSNLDTFVVYLK